MSELGFRHELEKLINRESMENGSNTPDYVLCSYLMDCLKAFDKAVTERSAWYDPKPRAGAAKETSAEDAPKSNETPLCDHETGQFVNADGTCLICGDCV